MNTEKVIDYIVNWMTSYANSARAKGFVVGVSGGIDSAVTSALAARTGKDVWCLEMPIHQAEDQVNRASRHIDQLMSEFSNVRRERLDLTAVFDGFLALLPKSEGEAHDMALVNTRARLRMTTLYYFAQRNGCLVAGTGNKVEDFGVGFYTKYGDGGVDLSPIADLNKSEVYTLGRVLGVSDAILNAPPTDGLWGDDRTDEDQIGASYPELEWAMDFVASGGDAEKLAGRKKEVFEIYTRLHRANRHKMVPIPVCEIPPELKKA